MIWSTLSSVADIEHFTYNAQAYTIHNLDVYRLQTIQFFTQFTSSMFIVI